MEGEQGWKKGEQRMMGEGNERMIEHMRAARG